MPRDPVIASIAPKGPLYVHEAIEYTVANRPDPSLWYSNPRILLYDDVEAEGNQKIPSLEIMPWGRSDSLQSVMYRFLGPGVHVEGTIEGIELLMKLYPEIRNYIRVIHRGTFEIEQGYSKGAPLEAETAGLSLENLKKNLQPIVSGNPAEIVYQELKRNPEFVAMGPERYPSNEFPSVNFCSNDARSDSPFEGRSVLETRFPISATSKKATLGTELAQNIFLEAAARLGRLQREFDLSGEWIVRYEFNETTG